MVSHSAGIWAGLQCSALFLGDTGWWSGPPLDAAVKGSRARRCYFFWSSPMYCIVRHWWVWFYVLQAIVPDEYTRWYPSPAYSYGPVLGTSTEVHTCGRWPHISASNFDLEISKELTGYPWSGYLSHTPPPRHIREHIMGFSGWHNSQPFIVRPI